MADSPSDEKTESAKKELRAAWDQLILEMQAARDTIDDPSLFPPHASPRVLAEGYRYLTGFLHHGVERAFHEDPDFPAFRNALSLFNKSTIENSDAIYFYSPIDGRKHYRITGHAEDSRHWRGEARLERAGRLDLASAEHNALVADLNTQPVAVGMPHGHARQEESVSRPDLDMQRSIPAEAVAPSAIPGKRFVRRDHRRPEFLVEHHIGVHFRSHGSSVDLFTKRSVMPSGMTHSFSISPGRTPRPLSWLAFQAAPSL